MLQSNRNQRKVFAKEVAGKLPTDLKPVAAPKSAARRRLLAGADIETSGGC
jgi:hypothetical protein